MESIQATPPEPYLSVTLAAVPTAGRFAVAIRFSNASSEQRFLDKRVAGLAGIVMSGVFDIEPKVPFIGLMARLPAPTEDDFVVIRAGEAVDVDIDLGAWFGFEPQVRYEVTYHAFLGEPTGSALFEVRSNPVVFAPGTAS